MTKFRGSYNSAHNPQFDAELDRNPPVIRWAKNKRGVMVAVEVRDPHCETSAQAQAERLDKWADRIDREEAARHAEAMRLQVVALMETEAAEVAERFRQHRADNTYLMRAARSI